MGVLKRYLARQRRERREKENTSNTGKLLIKEKSAREAALARTARLMASPPMYRDSNLSSINQETRNPKEVKMQTHLTLPKELTDVLPNHVNIIGTANSFKTSLAQSVFNFLHKRNDCRSYFIYREDVPSAELPGGRVTNSINDLPELTDVPQSGAVLLDSPWVTANINQRKDIISNEYILKYGVGVCVFNMYRSRISVNPSPLNGKITPVKTPPHAEPLLTFPTLLIDRVAVFDGKVGLTVKLLQAGESPLNELADYPMFHIQGTAH